ncbi:MAG: transaldolase family protein [Thermomicrobiales bacterium]
MGQVAIANARLAYQEFKKVFNSGRFSDLAGYGVRIQRPLWASTSTKNPDYPDTLYVDELIGPNTVETLAPASIDAFRDHGTVTVTVEKDVDVARDVIETMESLGISYDDVIDVLVKEGVEKFADSFHSLAETIESEMSRIAEDIRTRRRNELAGVAGKFDEVTDSLDSAGAAQALRESNGAFWSDDRQVASEISGLLGWLQSVPEMQALASAGLFESLADDVQRRGYDRLVLLGMGGSSLAPEVMAHTLEHREGFPRLTVLDSTHPDTIRRVADGMDGERTLFVVSSKSGSTIETSTLFEYFLDLNHGNADDFIVITDPGSPLEARARNLEAWKVFTNRHDIGGRFSALSYFGLVPAAASGIDVGALLEDAASVLPIHDIHHPGIALGAALAAAADAGRNKLTLLCTDHWASFGDWLEQLIAESTGKHGKGLVPIAREPVRPVADYGDDRVFAVIDDGNEEIQGLAESLREAGHPVIGLPAHLGQLFMTWEIATAILGQQLEINPFDQPNVQEAKDQTNKVLAGEVDADVDASSVEKALEFVMGEANQGDYVSIQAFVDASDDMVNALADLRASLAGETAAPIALGIGPRFLHSTGQLHKGGPNQGVFLQIFQNPAGDIEIPGRDWGFQRLFSAQADGDYLTLEGRDLRVIRVNVDSASDVSAMSQAASRSGVAAD